MDQNNEFNQFPGLPRNEGGPLFAEPWQLTAFGIVLALHRSGHFQWREWVNCLSGEIELGSTYGVDPENYNAIYYHQWLTALEKLVTEKKLSNVEELMARKEEWRHADEHRGFGEPLTLHGDDNHHHHHHGHDHGDEHDCRPAARRLS